MSLTRLIGYEGSDRIEENEQDRRGGGDAEGPSRMDGSGQWLL
jgi:hypothetical protein